MKFRMIILMFLAAGAMTLQAGAEITHRYTFEGNPNDVVGGAHGTETTAGGFFEAPDYSTAVPPGAVLGAPQQSIEFGMNKAVTNKSGVTIPSGVFGTASGSCSLWLRPDEEAKFYALNATGFKLMSNNGTTLTAKYDNGPTSYNDVGTSPGILTGEWVHALVTWDVATSNMAYYVNGTLAGSVSNATDILDNAFHIGGFNMNNIANNSDLQFVGLVYDLQFYDHVLSTGEVAQLSANPGSAIVSAPPELAHRYVFENDATDSVGSSDGTESGSADHLEAPQYTNAIPDNAVAGAPAQSLNVGMNYGSKKSGITVPSGVFSTHSGSYSVWLKADAWVNDTYMLNIGGTLGPRLSYTGGLAARYNNGGAYATVGTAAVAAGEWVHAAVTWDTATSNMSFYVDGALVATRNDLTGIGDGAFSVGSFNLFDSAPGLVNQFKGQIYDLQFYDGVLSATQVNALYTQPGLAITTAKITLPQIFNSGMVLQRNRAIPVWGVAAPDVEVTVTFAGGSKSVTADGDGAWRVELDALPASTTGRTMTISGNDGSSVEFTDILVGDVWVAGGQSNMEMPLNGVINANPERYAGFYENAGNSNIRYCRVAQVAGTYERPGKGWADWRAAQDNDSANLSQLSAVAYFFARDVQAAHPEIPIGVISSAWGGTVIEAWMNLDAADAAGVPYDGAPLYGTVPSGTINDRNIPGMLYENMIQKIEGYGTCGFLWYQGEANAGRAEDYRLQMPFLIESWRDAWGQGDLPFLFVQLPLKAGSWAEIRDAFLHTHNTVTNTGMAVTIDISQTPHQLNVPIHPYEKEPIGQRLALMAREMVFGDDLLAFPPIAVAKTIDGSDFYVHFKNTGTTLSNATSGSINGFFLSTNGTDFVAADSVEIDGDRVKVSKSGMAAPTHLRYAWDQDYSTYSEANAWGTNNLYSTMTNLNLVGSGGLSASPFEADDLLELTMAGFEGLPIAISSTEIWMTAVEGSGLAEPVEYLFTETSGNPGGSGSGWQTSSSYTDGGLTPDTLYSYTVAMRDALGHVSVSSAPASATTMATDPAPESLPALAGKVVAIWSKGAEKFVRSSEMNGGVLRADRKSYEEEGRFLGVAEAGDTMALLDMTQDYYVTHTNGKLASAVSGAAATRRFTLVDQGNHYYAIQADDEKYVRVDGAGELVVDAVSITDDALFAIVPVRTGPNVVMRAYEGWEADFHSDNPADFPVNKVNIGMLQMTPSLYTDTQFSDMRAVWNTDRYETEFILPYTTNQTLTVQVDALVNRIKRLEGLGYTFDYVILYHEILANLPGGPWSDPRIASQEEIDLFHERVTAAYNAGEVNHSSYKVFCMPYQFASNSVMGFSAGGVPANTPVGCDAATLEFIKNNFDGMFLEVNGHDYTQRDEDADAAAAAVWCRDNGLEFGITSGGSGKDTAYKTMYGNIFAEMEAVGFDASWDGMHYVLHHVHQPVSDRLPEWTANTTTENAKWLIEQVMPFEAPAISAIDTDGDGIADLVEIRAGTSPLEVTVSGYDDWAAAFSGIDLSDPVADYDNDGVDNLLEYALGGNPVSNDAAAALPVLQTLENVIVYVHNERTDDTSLAYTVQLRTNLVSDVWKTNGVEFVGAAAFSNVWKTVTNQVPILGKDQQFIRLKVEMRQGH